MVVAPLIIMAHDDDDDDDEGVRLLLLPLVVGDGMGECYGANNTE